MGGKKKSMGEEIRMKKRRDKEGNEEKSGKWENIKRKKGENIGRGWERKYIKDEEEDGRGSRYKKTRKR